MATTMALLFFIVQWIALKKYLNSVETVTQTQRGMKTLIQSGSPSTQTPNDSSPGTPRRQSLDDKKEKVNDATNMTQDNTVLGSNTSQVSQKL